MADDQVKYSELLVKDEDVFANLIKELGDVKTKISELKSEASGLSSVLKNISSATREQQQATAANAKSVEVLAQKTKDLAATKKNLEDAAKRFGNLTDEEVGRLDRLATKLKFSSQWQEATAKLVDTTNMSYNEMKATLAVLTNALHTFGTEEKKNSDEAKALENAIERVRDAMKDLDDRTKAVAAAEKQMAEEAKKAAKEEEEFYKASQKEAAQRVKTQEDLHNARQKEIEDAFKARDAELAKLKLTEEEYNSLQQLKAALQGTSQEQIAAVQNIDIQNKSYNELYQTYNAIKEALKAMSTGEWEASEAGKALTEQAKNIHDTLNALQQSTGVYTLNIGNYESALNGLKMQFQQIMREIPSAQNLSQFFLAISNNVPMFADALLRYKKELPNVKDKFEKISAEIVRQRGILDTLVEGSTEHQQKLEQINGLLKDQKRLQELSVSPAKAIWQAFKSWQTLLIGGLLLLRKIPDIIKWISEKWDRWRNGVREVKNEMTAVAAIARMQADVIQKTADEVTELKLIAERLKDVQQGTEEWAAGVATVNEITKANLDTTKATPAEVDKVTDAYIRQARQLAKNAILTDMIAKSDANLSKREVAYHPGDYGTARQTLGLEIGSKDEQEFGRLFIAMNRAIQDYNNKVRRTEWASVRDAAGNMTMRRVEENENLAANRRRKEMNDAIQDYRNFINKRLEVLSPEAVKKLQEQYELIDPMGSGNGNRNSKPSEQNVTSRYWEAQEALLREQYKGYELERALAKMNHDKALSEQENWLTEQTKALDENLKNGFITQQEYDTQLAELKRQDTDLQKGIERKYWEDLRALRMKNLADRKKEWKTNADEVEKNAKDNAKRELKAAVDGWAQYKAKMVEEGKTRKQIVEAEVAAEIARLNLMLQLNRDVNGEKMSDEQKTKVQEWINLLEKLQQTGNYGDYKPGQFMGKGGANVTNERKNYANIWEVLGIDMDNNQVSALNSVFDQAKEALNSWMDARKAAADQAKELADDEVSAAENALNREIELRNQGYANDVALREKELADAKAAQKKAVEEQKKIAGEQILLDAALQTSSLITASANIWKQFGTQPLLAIAMLGTMWGSFLYSKAKAYQVSQKSVQFKEGGVMLLEGGSHESGHDVNLGIGPDGSNLRAEGGEYFAVINKRNSRKYGSEIPAVVNALNSGMFENRYIKTSDAVGLMGNVGVVGNVGESADLSRLESGVGELVKQGEQNWTIEGGYRVLRYKNLTRRVKIG